jgi:hypothetical protein
MAKLTESYLRRLIKQVVKENFDYIRDEDPSSPEEESYQDMDYVAEDLSNIFMDIMDAIDEGEYAEATAIANKGLDKVKDLTNSLEKGYNREYDKSTARRNVADITGEPHKYSAGPHMSPTMDENRRRRTASKRK